MSGTRPVLIVNVSVVTPDAVVPDSWIRLEGGVIAGIGAAGAPAPEAGPDADIVDGRGGYAVPGFIDLHVHGGAGFDFMDADREGIDAILRYHARHGTTSLLATSVTAPRQAIDDFLGRMHAYRASPMPYAKLLGVHLEGPFISRKWAGAQNPACIVPPRLDWLEAWTAAYPGLIKMQTLAPEADGALDYIKRLDALGIVPSCGHTDATYGQIAEAVRHGLRHAVHTFNAMRPFHHREPGTAGAVLTLDEITAEVVADGLHVHPAGVRLLLAAKDVDRIVLVTDAIMAAGMPDGDYTIGGLPVELKDGAARLKHGGSLAGSVLTMIDAFRFVMKEAGAPLVHACRMASTNPARQLGIDRYTGALEAGKSADVLLLDRDYALRRVWVDGRPAA